MKINDVIVEQIADKATAKDKNGNVYTYTAATNSWTNKDGQVATGLLAQQLAQQHGYDIDGSTPKKPGIVQRAKNYFSGKTQGMAQATRGDKDASIGKKIAGIAGAAIGGALAGGKPQVQGPQHTELPIEIKAQVDNLTKQEKNYLMDKLGQIDTSKRGADNVQLVRGGN